MTMIKDIWIDTETTGTEEFCNIWSISFIPVFDGIRYPAQTFKMCPIEGTHYAEEAMKVGNITEEEIRKFPPEHEVFEQVIAYLDTLVDKFKGRKEAEPDRMLVCGYNVDFDTNMTRKWFAQHLTTTKKGEEINIYGAYFISNGAYDVMSLVLDIMRPNILKLPNLKLTTVLTHEFGLNIKNLDLSKAHGSEFDIKCTYRMYLILKKLEDKSSAKPYIRPGYKR